MTYQYDDGGRKAAGYKGDAGDCGVRALAIAGGMPYQEVYRMVNEYGKNERGSRRRVTRSGQPKRSRSRTGIYAPTYRKMLADLGWSWTPTMQIGAGCRVHLRPDELPPGRLIVNLSRHFSAVLDGVVRDTHDSARGGTRCVYGYWQPPKGTP